MRLDQNKHQNMFMHGSSTWLGVSLLWLAALSLSSCGGGGGGTPTTTTYYSISVAVTGLSGNLVLHNNRNLSNDALTFTADGSGTFTATVASGTPYGVSVSSQPTNQFCTVTNGSGTASASIPAISVDCVTAYTIGGNVSGLNGTGLVLQNNAGDNLPISADGNFTFTTKLTGGTYSVTMLNRPRSPVQNCTVANSTGTVSGANVFNVAINCGAPIFIPDKPRYAYVANNSDGTVSGYIVDALTGQLRPNGYVYVGQGTAPSSVAVDPSGKFAYVANSQTNTVSAYTINAAGRLTSVAQPVAAGSGPSSVTVDPSGRFVYVSNVTGQDIAAYSINLGTGALTQVPCLGGVVAGCSGNNVLNYLIPGNPTSVAVSPAGQRAYVTHDAGVSAYSIDSYGALADADSDATAAGTQASIAAGASPNAIGIDPSGAYAYVAGSGAIRAFSINASTGALADNSTTTLTGTLRGVAVDPYGLSAYVANNSGSVSEYTITGTGALATSPATLLAGTGPAAVAVDPSGMFAYVANVGSSDIHGYDIFGSPITATAAITARARPGSTAIAISKGDLAVSYTPTYAYVANSGSGDISAYAISPGNGALTTVTCSGCTVTGNPKSVAVHPSGDVIYVVDGTNVLTLTIDPLSGTLTVDGSLIVGSGANSVTVDPSGRFAYVTDGANGRVWGFGIDAATGVLAPIDTDATTTDTQSFITTGGINPSAVTIDPTGRFAYVANTGSASVSAFIINPANGALSQIICSGTCVGDNFPAGTSPKSVAVDPSGRYVYVANSGTNDISAYTISASTGALTPIANYGAGTSPVSIAVDPTGRFAYAANADTANNVYAYSINSATGALTAGTAITLAGSVTPSAITVDISGSYAYVTHSGGITACTIGATGALTCGTAVPAGSTPASVATTGTIQ